MTDQQKEEVKRTKGTSCHQCKNTKPIDKLAFCSKLYDKRTKPEKRKCQKKFCEGCLLKFYNENLNDILANHKQTWVCPACKGKCSCAACHRNSQAAQQGLDPRQLMQMLNQNLVGQMYTGANGQYGMMPGMQPQALPSSSFGQFPQQPVAPQMTGLGMNASLEQQQAMLMLMNAQQAQQQLQYQQRQIQVQQLVAAQQAAQQAVQQQQQQQQQQQMPMQPMQPIQPIQPQQMAPQSQPQSPQQVLSHLSAQSQSPITSQQASPVPASRTAPGSPSLEHNLQNLSLQSSPQGVRRTVDADGGFKNMMHMIHMRSQSQQDPPTTSGVVIPTPKRTSSPSSPSAERRRLKSDSPSQTKRSLKSKSRWPYNKCDSPRSGSNSPIMASRSLHNSPHNSPASSPRNPSRVLDDSPSSDSLTSRRITQGSKSAFSKPTAKPTGFRKSYKALNNSLQNLRTHDEESNPTESKNTS